jgi:arsenate reductase-like glutaredoxin family protein
MAAKRVKFYTFGDDDRCHDIRKFIEEAGVLLDMRDIEKEPLDYYELDRLFGYCEISHFVNKASETYGKKKLDQQMPPRDEVLKLMAEDNRLIRRPIVETTRLFTVGCNKKAISDMLLLSRDSEPSKSESRKSGGSKDSGSRSSRRSHNRQEAYSAAGK